MKKSDLIEVMTRTYNEDPESYDELWKAVGTLINLGLLDESFGKTLVKTDNELFRIANLTPALN